MAVRARNSIYATTNKGERKRYLRIEEAKESRERRENN
jgi:hypothetical protein